MWNDMTIMQNLQEVADQTPIAWVPSARMNQFGEIHRSQVQPASLDVRLAAQFIRHPDARVFEATHYQLSAGECVLASTVERFAIPDDVVARVEGKSTLARQFLTIHSAGFVDPGFRGDLTLEIKNDGARPIILEAGMRIAQVSFQTLVAPALRPYGTKGLQSKYQGQWGPVEAGGADHAESPTA